MAHAEQIQHCRLVKYRMPHHFSGVEVLDCGSHDINGNNRHLFDLDCTYTGLDILEGANVDVVGLIHEHTGEYDTIISCSCFEHDKYYVQSLNNMIEMLRPGGFMLVTCASIACPEHGTSRHLDWASPGTNDYYKNLTIDDICKAIHFPTAFSDYEITLGNRAKDLYFWGIKRETT